MIFPIIVQLYCKPWGCQDIRISQDDIKPCSQVCVAIFFHFSNNYFKMPSVFNKQQLKVTKNVEKLRVALRVFFCPPVTFSPLSFLDAGELKCFHISHLKTHWSSYSEDKCTFCPEGWLFGSRDRIKRPRYSPNIGVVVIRPQFLVWSLCERESCCGCKGGSGKHHSVTEFLSQPPRPDIWPQQHQDTARGYVQAVRPSLTL